MSKAQDNKYHATQENPKLANHGFFKFVDMKDYEHDPATCTVENPVDL